MKLNQYHLQIKWNKLHWHGFYSTSIGRHCIALSEMWTIPVSSPEDSVKPLSKSFIVIFGNGYNAGGGDKGWYLSGGWWGTRKRCGVVPNPYIKWLKHWLKRSLSNYLCCSAFIIQRFQMSTEILILILIRE